MDNSTPCPGGQQASEERWKNVDEITGFEEFVGYRVSDRGRVQSRWRQKRGKRVGGDRWFLSDEWRDLHPSLNHYGYLHIGLRSSTGRCRHPRIHRLLLSAFRGPPPWPGAWALHKNDVKVDNSLDNLYWGSAATNQLDKKRNGRTNKGERNGHNRLREADVLEVYRLASGGATYAEIAARFDISRTAVYLISKGKKWTHLGLTPLPKRHSGPKPRPH